MNNPYPLEPHVHKTWIIDQIRALNPKTVLDVGCAGGTGLWFYSKEFPEIKFTGIDLLAENVLKEREELFNGKVKLEVGDIRAISFKDNSFDLVISDSVINTLDRKDDIVAVKELTRVAKKHVLFLEQNCLPDQFGSNNYGHDFKTLLPEIKLIFKVTGYGDSTWDEYGWLMRYDK